MGVPGQETALADLASSHFSVFLLFVLLVDAADASNDTEEESDETKNAVEDSEASVGSDNLNFSAITGEICSIS